MKIAITGSGGLLGKCILHAAQEKGFAVVPIHFLVSNDHDFRNSVITTLANIRDCDFVINCAASKSPKNLFDFYLNAEVPSVIKDYISCHNLNCKFIHISSINVVIGSLKDKYTKSKRMGEELLYGRDVKIIRPGLIWSPQSDPILIKISDYFKRPLFPKFMIKPGNLYCPLNPDTLANFILDELFKWDSSAQIINVLGNRKLMLWDLMDQLAKSSNSKLIPIPTSIFKLFPWEWCVKNLNNGEAFNQMLSIDRSKVEVQIGERIIVLPFLDEVL